MLRLTLPLTLTAALATLLLALLMARPTGAQVQALEAWWIDTGETDTTSLGTDIAPLGDLNQDGFDDFIVGSAEEKAFIYFGSAQPDTIPRMIIPSPNTGLSLFAAGVYGIGDINNDGGEDFAAIAIVSQDPDHFQAFLYFGGSMLDTIPDLILDGGEITASDFGIYGGPAGDFNDDGGSDFILLDPEYRAIGPSSIKGRAYLFFGGDILDSIADWQISGGNPFSCVGQDAAPLGDVNGDGCDDFVLVDSRSAGPQGEVGMGYIAVYYGSSNPDTIPDLVIWGEEADAALGMSVAGIDFNQDGRKDIVVGSYKAYPPDHLSSVYVYLLPISEPYVPDFIFLDQGGIDNTTGWGLLGIDLNGDGWQDIVSNNPYNVLDAGETYVYLGGVYADTLLDAVYFQGHTQCALGAGAANVGDINNDGIEDLVIGEQGYNYFVYGSFWGRLHAILGDTVYHQSVGVAPEGMTPPVPSALQLTIFPNPFNSQVTFRIQYQGKEKPTLQIFNLRGELIRQYRPISRASAIIWDGYNSSDTPCTSGIYIARLQAGNFTAVQKMVLIK